MNKIPFKNSIPNLSRVASLVLDCHFHDSWSILPASPQLSAMDQFVKAFSSAPAWVNACMGVRNRLARFVGIKNLGAFNKINSAKSAYDYKPGDRIGIFTLISNTFNEVVVGDKDKHLDVVLSVYREIQESTGAVVITVTTIVHVHNWLGRLYMIPVAPMHKIIAPSVLRAIARIEQ
ncbi:MAG: DUF2867 domain-containing protein [Gammaproteobacteria bacterium]|nr:DUF2867 domain-containing protein [Gammaproteobacteria bacterium]